MYMMRAQLSVLVLSGLLVLSLGDNRWGHGYTSNGRTVKRCDVVVIGGGGSGANSAVFAKDKGYSVCIVEKDNEIGGHCDTIPLASNTVPSDCTGVISLFNGRCPNWVDVGVLVYSNTTAYNLNGLGQWQFDSAAHLKRFAGASNVVSGSFTQFGQSQSLYADMAHNQLFIPPQPSTPQEALLEYQLFEQAVETLVELMYVQYPFLDDVVNLPDPMPVELTQPFPLWVHANQLDILYWPLFQELVGTVGLGDFGSLTTYYALLSMRRGILALYGIIPGVDAGLYIWGGCDALYSGISDYIGEDNIFTSAEVTNVVRGANSDDGDDEDSPMRPVRVDFKIGNKRYRIKANKLIVAIPPTAGNMAFLSDQTNEESALFSKVQLRYSIPAVLQESSPFSNALYAKKTAWYMYNVDPMNPFLQAQEPSIFSIGKFWYYQFPVLTYFAAHPEDLYTTNNNIASQLSTVPLLQAQLNYPVPHSQYQPYFSASDLQASPNPYTRFGNIQGQSNTIYVGATFSFAEQVKVMEHAYRTVNAHL
jgi:hypothetical protein